MPLYNKLLILIISFFIISCAEKTYYSGKIYLDDIDFDSFTSKKEIINKLGEPNYIDPLENNYYYFTEKLKRSYVLPKKINERLIVIYSFNNLNEITFTNKINLDDQKKLSLIDDKTKNNLIEKGLIEKIFGGVATQKIVE